MDRICKTCTHNNKELDKCDKGMTLSEVTGCKLWSGRKSGNSMRIKGDGFERLVVDIIKRYPAFKDTRRQYASGATEPAIFKNDVFTRLAVKFLEYKLFIECKHHEKIGIYKFYNGARDKISSAIGYLPALAIKQDYTKESDILICLPLVIFCEMVQKLGDYIQDVSSASIDASDKPEVLRACRKIEDYLELIKKEVKNIKEE